MSPRQKKEDEQDDAAQKAGDETARSVEKNGPGVGDEPSDPEELREEIAETREELGATVEALSDKADVKAQLSEKQAEVKAKASELGGKVADAPPVQQAKERPAVALAAALGVSIVIGFLLRRR